MSGILDRIKRQLRTLRDRHLGEGLILNDKTVALGPSIAVDEVKDENHR